MAFVCWMARGRGELCDDDDDTGTKLEDVIVRLG